MLFLFSKKYAIWNFSICTLNLSAFYLKIFFNDLKYIIKLYFAFISMFLRVILIFRYLHSSKFWYLFFRNICWLIWLKPHIIFDFIWYFFFTFYKYKIKLPTVIQIILHEGYLLKLIPFIISIIQKAMIVNND